MFYKNGMASLIDCIALVTIIMHFFLYVGSLLSLVSKAYPQAISRQLQVIPVSPLQRYCGTEFNNRQKIHQQLP